jgi:transposase-like protein
VWLDATFHKVRELGRVVSVATVVAVGVDRDGQRHVLGCDTGPSEDHVFWTRFLRHLVKRGVKGVRLVVSDSHEGLKGAIVKVFAEASWQRCRVHFMRNLLAYMHFPREHWRQLHLTNTLERINKELKRRTSVVQIFPNRDSLVRMVATHYRSRTTSGRSRIAATSASSRCAGSTANPREVRRQGNYSQRSPRQLRWRW